MKKLFALMLCLALVLSLAACGNDPAPTTQPTTAPTTQPTTAPTTQPTTAPTTEPTTEPPLTVEQVYADVQAAMLNIEATRLRMELGFGVSYKEGEGEDAQTTEIGYDMVVDTIISADPFGSFATSSIGFDTESFDMDITVDVYIVEEEGTVVTYAQAFDTWSRTDSGMTVDEFLTSGEMTEISTSEVWMGGEMPYDMTLDEFTQNLDGTEVYILRCTIPADSLGEALTELGVDLTEDTDEIAMPVTYYVDTQNHTILRMDADMTALTDLLSAAMAESLLGSEDNADDVKMEISNAVYLLGYGPQEIPALPQEALEQDYTEDPAVDPTPSLPSVDQATDLGNGSFVLPCGTEAVTITCPAGWVGEVYDVNNIWIYAEDQSQYGDFYYFTSWTEDDFRNLVQQDVDALTNAQLFISSGDGPVYEGFTTAEVIGDGESYCYAWTPMGEGYLLVIFADFTDSPDFSTLVPQLLDPITDEFSVQDIGSLSVATDLGNGTFALPCGDQTYLLTTPEGWAGEIASDNNIWFYNEDFSLVYDFYYWDGWSMEDPMDWVLDDVNNLKNEDIYLSHGDGPDCGEYKTQIVLGNGCSYYYAWISTGDGVFMGWLYDNTGINEPDTLVPQMLTYVSIASADAE